MRILVTGASSYIGKRLLVNLIEASHEVNACVREPPRLYVSIKFRDIVTIFISQMGLIIHEKNNRNMSHPEF